MARKEIPRELETAIREEERAARRNAESARLTDNPKGAAMFRELAEFHGHNAELLKKRLTPVYEESDSGMVETAVDFAAMEAKTAHADALAALEADIALEKESGEKIREAARAKTGEERTLLRRVAEEIELNRRILDDEFYLLTNTGLAVWGD
ncbi:hypothetical protein EPN96_05265 [bacterium]|nr:MAG: hypothetical protein EPN96_05265 [bacterium]